LQDCSFVPFCSRPRTDHFQAEIKVKKRKKDAPFCCNKLSLPNNLARDCSLLASINSDVRTDTGKTEHHHQLVDYQQRQQQKAISKNRKYKMKAVKAKHLRITTGLPPETGRIDQ